MAAPAPGAVVPPGLMMAGAGLLAAATVAGAWLARRRPGQQQIWLGAAAGALPVTAALHVLPDAWSQARAAGIWPWAVPLAAAGAFLLTGLATLIGCTCGRIPARRGGTGAAAALAIHRFLEGIDALASALALIRHQGGNGITRHA